MLRNGPDSIDLELPDGRVIDFARKQFVPRAGYVERLDCSGNEIPDADPQTPLSFRWYGELPNHGWLAITVVNDVVRGTLVTGENSYQLSGSPEYEYILSEIDPEGLPPTHAEAIARPENPIGYGLGKQTNAQFHVESYSQTRAAGSVELDMLIMYTAQAELDAGGPMGLDALIQMSIDNTNQALINSGYADLSVNVVGRELLTGFIPSGSTQTDAIFDRDQLRLNPQILAARDAYFADVTMVLLRNARDNSGFPQLGACGATYIQSPTCGAQGDVSQCGGVGTGFEDYALAWVSVECAVLADRNSFPHEPVYPVVNPVTFRV